MRIILCRHGETEWSLSGQHTGRTNLPLTKKGEEQAKSLQKLLAPFSHAKVHASPLLRAYHTCELALAPQEIVIEPNALEWDYGKYEGMTTVDIHKQNPNWNIFKDGAPLGESPTQVGDRADLLLEKWVSAKEDIILFSHGHFLRVLTARWLNLPPVYGKCFQLSVGSMSILGFERSERALQLWNYTPQISN